jgi:hypothetical protein
VEKKSSRIVIYGHSWGASETVTLSRELAIDGIPVLLTIQVDSGPKRGRNEGAGPGGNADSLTAALVKRKPARGMSKQGAQKKTGAPEGAPVPCVVPVVG